MGRVLRKSTVVLVKKILQQKPKARDNDRFLEVVIWNKEADALKINTRKEYLQAYYAGKLTPSKSIIRVRRKLQAMYPELRGEKYEERMEKLEPKVKEELKNLEQKP